MWLVKTIAVYLASPRAAHPRLGQGIAATAPLSSARPAPPHAHAAGPARPGIAQVPARCAEPAPHRIGSCSRVSKFTGGESEKAITFAIG